MPVSQHPNNLIKNRLLAALPPEEYERLLPNLETVPLNFKQVLYDINEPIKYIYFPKNCLASLLTIMENGEAVEVGTVGNEGMVGLPVFLGADTIPGQAFVQIPGDGMRMRTDVFKREVIRRYTVVQLAATLQASAI